MDGPREGRGVKWRKNEIRRFFAASLDRAALGAIGLGLFKPIFEPGPDDIWLILLAFVAAIAFEGIALYLLNSLEDE